MEQESKPHIFLPGWDKYNKPQRIVTFGHYYPQGQSSRAKELVKRPRMPEGGAEQSLDVNAVRDNLFWTRLINALNLERQWPLKHLYSMLDPMLAEDIAIAVVPPHRAYQAFWPMRTLAQSLAKNGRLEATVCLVRTETIRRIVYGGPSTKMLHRRTIQISNPDLIRGRRVLLMDDIAKSGQSLVACREMLFGAGAETVQAVALARVILTQDQ